MINSSYLLSCEPGAVYANEVAFRLLLRLINYMNSDVFIFTFLRGDTQVGAYFNKYEDKLYVVAMK